MPTNPLIISFTFWLILSALLYLALRPFLAKTYTDDELLLEHPKSQPKSFPFWYSYLYFVILFGCLAFAIFALFYSPFVVTYLQKLLYSTPDTTLFIAPLTVTLSGLPSFFVGLLIYMLTASFLLKFIPDFAEYATLRDSLDPNTKNLSEPEKQKIWQEAFKKLNLKRLSQNNFRSLALLIIVMWLICGLVYVFAMDDYVAIRDGKVIVNPLTELQETSYSMSDIQSVNVSPNFSQDNDGDYSLTPKFELQFTDGKKLDVWGGIGFGSPSAESLTQLADALHQKDVHFEVDELDSIQELEAVQSYDDVAKQTVKTVFEHISSFDKD